MVKLSGTIDWRVEWLAASSQNLPPDQLPKESREFSSSYTTAPNTSALILLSFVSFYFAVSAEEIILFFVGLVVLLGATIYGVVKARVVVPQKIDDHYVWLNGINDDYLKQFPEWLAAR